MVWQAFARHQRQPAADVMFVTGATLDFNPTFDPRAIAVAYAEDPVAAATEYGGHFRSDLESFVSRAAVEGCVVRGRLELLPRVGVAYRAFTDAATGGGEDAFTIAIDHVEHGDGVEVRVLDCVRETRPPFSPEAVIAEYAQLLRRYGLGSVVGDHYAGAFVSEAFMRCGISYQPSARTRSELYRDALPWFNSGRVELLDHEHLVNQLCALERRPGTWGGRDVIDHPPGGHDDVCNAVCGALAIAVQDSWLEVMKAENGGVPVAVPPGAAAASEAQEPRTHLDCRRAGRGAYGIDPEGRCTLCHELVAPQVKDS
jgi:hypothetical protein